MKITATTTPTAQFSACIMPLDFPLFSLTEHWLDSAVRWIKGKGRRSASTPHSCWNMELNDHFPFNSSDPLLISLYRSLYWLQCHFHWTRGLTQFSGLTLRTLKFGSCCFVSFFSRLIKALLTSWINVQSICFSSRSKSVKLIDWLRTRITLFVLR